MIYIGSDHGGYTLKEEIKKHLETQNISFEDCGTHSTDSVDYPDNAKTLCEKISDNDTGILICGTGIGISIAANKCNGIRAALCTNTTMARFTRLHNNANVLCMGERIIGTETAKSIVNIFLGTTFEGGRHERRVNKIMDLEN
jgi:ribose 5-phosphate isomerase B